MSITVGIVHHRARGAELLKSDRGLEVRSRVNAGPDREPWLGFGENHNQLIEGVDDDWYVALNPDVMVASQQIADLVRAADRAGMSICAPLLRAPWGVTGLPQVEFPGARAWLRETFLGSRDLSRPLGGLVVPSAWVSGACMAIRVADGLRFNEAYFLYFEDADLCWRAWRRGLRVGVCTGVVVEHASGWSSRDDLLLHRGVQFARGAATFAETRELSPMTARGAGLLKAVSRSLLPRRSASERAAAKALRHGFSRMRSAPGIEDLAREHNGGSI